MKKQILLSALILALLVLAACSSVPKAPDFDKVADSQDIRDELDGTSWRASSEGVVFIISFSSSNFTLTGIYDGETETTKGTYSISGSTVTLTFDGDTETGTLSGNRLTIEGTTFTKQ